MFGKPPTRYSRESLTGKLRAGELDAGYGRMACGVYLVPGRVLLGDTSCKPTNDTLLLDVASLSIRIETAGGINILCKLIPRNITIPTKTSEILFSLTPLSLCMGSTPVFEFSAADGHLILHTQVWVPWSILSHQAYLPWSKSAYAGMIIGL